MFTHACVRKHAGHLSHLPEELVRARAVTRSPPPGAAAAAARIFPHPHQPPQRCLTRAVGPLPDGEIAGGCRSWRVSSVGVGKVSSAAAAVAAAGGGPAERPFWSSPEVVARPVLPGYEEQ